MYSVVSDSLQHFGLYVACQATLTMRFFRQEYWSGLPFPTPGIEPASLVSPTLADTLYYCNTWEALTIIILRP